MSVTKISRPDGSKTGETARCIRFAVLVLFAASIVACGPHGNESAQKKNARETVERLFRAIESGNGQALARLGTIPASDTSTSDHGDSDQNGKTTIDQLRERFTDGITWSIEDVRIDGRNALVSVSLENDGTSQATTTHVPLRWKHGRWKIVPELTRVEHYDFVPID